MNCDRDSVRSDDQDNCDRHVRCLQGEGAPGHRSATLPRVSPTRAALEAELGARGLASMCALMFLKTCPCSAPQRQRAPPPWQSSGEEQPHLPPPPGLESANAEHLLYVRTFTQILI